jgi:hypothetical protein
LIAVPFEHAVGSVWLVREANFNDPHQPCASGGTFKGKRNQQYARLGKGEPPPTHCLPPSTHRNLWHADSHGRATLATLGKITKKMWGIISPEAKAGAAKLYKLPRVSGWMKKIPLLKFLHIESEHVHHGDMMQANHTLVSNKVSAMWSCVDASCG